MANRRRILILIHIFSLENFKNVFFTLVLHIFWTKFFARMDWVKYNVTRNHLRNFIEKICNAFDEVFAYGDVFRARDRDALVELYFFVLLQWWPANNLIFLQKNVAAKMDLLWKFLKPISFALIGKEVNFGKLDGTVVAYGFVIILLGSVVCLEASHISFAFYGDDEYIKNHTMERIYYSTMNSC